METLSYDTIKSEYPIIFHYFLSINSSYFRFIMFLSYDDKKTIDNKLHSGGKQEANELPDGCLGLTIPNERLHFLS